MSDKNEKQAPPASTGERGGDCDDHRPDGPDPIPNCGCAAIDRLVARHETGTRRPIVRRASGERSPRAGTAAVDAGLGTTLRAAILTLAEETDRAADAAEDDGIPKGSRLPHLRSAVSRVLTKLPGAPVAGAVSGQGGDR